jgi:hypothetical protein
MEAVAICRPDLSLPLAIPLGSFQSRWSWSVSHGNPSCGGLTSAQLLTQEVDIPTDRCYDSFAPPGLGDDRIHPRALWFISWHRHSSLLPSEGGPPSGGSRIAIRALQMASAETTTSKELWRRFHHSWVRAPNKTGPTGRESIAQG